MFWEIGISYLFSYNYLSKCSSTSVCDTQTTYLFDLKFLGESSSYQHHSDLMFPSLLSVLVFSSENAREQIFVFHIKF